MTNESVKVGQDVRLTECQRRGTVQEVDHADYAARVQLNGGGETWAHFDELEIVEPWVTRRLDHANVGGSR